MVISFSFIVVVCNDTKKQNVLMTVVLSKRKSDGSSLEIPSPDEPRQVELKPILKCMMERLNNSYYKLTSLFHQDGKGSVS